LQAQQWQRAVRPPFLPALSDNQSADGGLKTGFRGFSAESSFETSNQAEACSMISPCTDFVRLLSPCRLNTLNNTPMQIRSC
jgi:hypothetical protein